ncbi:MAG: hypothetical protein U1F98_01040 [Verrucomicrobiota bacterium]
MNLGPTRRSLREHLFVALLLPIAVCAANCFGAGVTLITHGLNDNADGWVAGMAGQITNYYRVQGENFAVYRMYFYFNSADGHYYLASERLSGNPPGDGNSDEIIVELDWGLLADGNSYNTYQVAAAVAPALLSTNFIPDLNGHALAELPIHMIGHSRGGSLISELSHLLGTNGLWINHLTTLDPHPLNNDGFNLDRILYSAVDAPVHTYQNVLYHDNYYQNMNFLVHGESVAGAYVRQLTSLSGGYTSSESSAPAHSNVHLWYFGTVDLNTPASYLEGGYTISVDSSMRSTWWNGYEDQGSVAGFYYSSIGGGDRLSADRPLGVGHSAIHDGYNQWWDFGAGVANNRTALDADNGNWPNVIRLDRLATNGVVQGQSTPLEIYFQWAQPATQFASITLCLDDDLNPINTNQTVVAQFDVAGTGASTYASFLTTNVLLAASNSAPGSHVFFAKITANGKTRYTYASQPVQVLSSRQPPVLDIAMPTPAQAIVGVTGLAGQTVVIQTSADLLSWLPVATNVLAADRWSYTNTVPASTGSRFYRGILP